MVSENLWCQCVSYARLWARTHFTMASYTQRDPNVVTPLGYLTITKLPDVWMWVSITQVTRHQVSTTSWCIRCLPCGVVIDHRHCGQHSFQIWRFISLRYDVWWRYENWDKLLSPWYHFYMTQLQLEGRVKKNSSTMEVGVHMSIKTGKIYLALFFELVVYYFDLENNYV